MNETNQNGETSRRVFIKMSLRFPKEQLDEILEKIDSVWESLDNDRDLQIDLEIARDQVYSVRSEIEEREEKVDRLIRSIAS